MYLPLVQIMTNFLVRMGQKRLKKWLSIHQDECPLVGENTRLGAPICRPSKIVCVGLNYAKHAKKSGMDVPSEPVLFFKASSAIIGPYDEVILPKTVKNQTGKLNWRL